MNNYEQTATDILNSMTENVPRLPVEVSRLLYKITVALKKKFPDMPQKSVEYSSCMFLFLHVITPGIVDPFSTKLISTPITERSIITQLVRIGKALQGFVNSRLAHEKSSSFNSSEESDFSSEDALSSPHRDALKAPGEQAAERFMNAVFSVINSESAKTKVEAEEISEATKIITAVLKKNKSFLQELENAIDRNQVLTKYKMNKGGDRMFAQETKSNEIFSVVVPSGE